jgi:hypothetical protein
VKYFKVFGSKYTKGAKQDSQNQLRLPMTEGNYIQNQLRLPMTEVYVIHAINVPKYMLCQTSNIKLTKADL